ncbi:MAG: 4-hydroxythreonine-4-phosphate dehydrogenase PdxA [Proteobacteria bacterium]|nr:4-hydroxythreonine-4-phosphate dehydrogenase PdxA [Pseudomonadota bacterium]MDA1024170.1 4-hydroxythreonine-4-phosphate dehydrogenase PdxA [Pseudomonadota bacterium]
MNIAPLALTMGEPAGIGGEITLKAWSQRRLEGPPFFVIDDPRRLEKTAELLGMNVPVREIDSLENVATIFADCLPVLKIDLPKDPIPGTPDPENASAVRTSIETAVRLVASSEAGAMVTNPIHKSTLYDAGFDFPGHTEYLGTLAGMDTPPVMMLACDELRVIPVTVHLSLAAAIAGLNTGIITQAGLIAANALKNDFAIAKPRLAVAGLNPHAGENGAMGSEEAEIIAPAIEALREVGIDAFGPVPPDTLFTNRARKTYDAALCMYHDQALIPIKAIAFETAVNVTLGLPFVRTSPDHGTAFDIAGTGKADETSLLAALDMAALMTRNRAIALAA